MPTHLRAKLAAAALLPLLALQPAYGWGRDGHLMINRLAALYLPQDVPAFLRNGEAIDTIEYLGPEPDRWKNRAEEELSSTQSPDHFIDMEWADYAGALPKRRYDFIRALAAAQPAHPDIPLTPEKVGMQPYQVEEVYERLKSTLRDYRRLVAANQDTRPAETAILFYAGWLGHYVGDASQPLHTTDKYNGWVGPNPNGYTTEHKIHWQFEGPFVAANINSHEVAEKMSAAKVIDGDMFDAYVAYLRHTATYVEKVYQLEKAGGFVGKGSPESREFTAERLGAGASMLRDMIYTAWIRSGDPVADPYAGK